jgi:hypothetical protein
MHRRPELVAASQIDPQRSPERFLRAGTGSGRGGDGDVAADTFAGAEKTRRAARGGIRLRGKPPSSRPLSGAVALLTSSRVIVTYQVS